MTIAQRPEGTVTVTEERAGVFCFPFVGRCVQAVVI